MIKRAEAALALVMTLDKDVCLGRLYFPLQGLLLGAECDNIGTVATACKRDTSFSSLDRDSPLKSFVLA